MTRMVRLRWLEGMYNGCPIVYTTVYVPVRLFPEMEEQTLRMHPFTKCWTVAG